METTKDLNTVSAWLFFLLAFSYAAAAVMLRNDFQVPYAVLGIRILDTPLALVALIYGGSSLYLQLTEGKDEEETPWGVIIFGLCLVLFSGIAFVNFAFPSNL